MKSKFKIGDTVMRINDDNGWAALVGQIATVVHIDERDNSLFVEYPGHGRSTRGPGELWWPTNARLVSARSAVESASHAYVRDEEAGGHECCQRCGHVRTATPTPVAVEPRLPATYPYVDRVIRILLDRPNDDTTALVLIDYAKAAIAALPTAQAAAQVSDAVFWAQSPGWLIDHCEGERITEEFLQLQASRMFAALRPSDRAEKEQ